MLGSIVGDIIGSIHEGAGTKTKHFPLFGPHNHFTDDTVLTVAVAESILRGTDLVDALHDYFHRYPWAGYGGAFIQWARQYDWYRLRPTSWVLSDLESGKPPRTRS